MAPDQILNLSQEFGLKRVTIVGDKGMVRGPQIKQLKAAGLSYITSVTKMEIAWLIKEGNIQYELFTEKIAEAEEETEDVYEKLTSNNEVIREKRKRVIRYVIRRNPTRKVKIRKNRDESLRKVIGLASDRTQYLLESTWRNPMVALRKVRDKICRYKLNSAITAQLSGNKSRVITVKTDSLAYERLGTLR